MRTKQFTDVGSMRRLEVEAGMGKEGAEGMRFSVDKSR